MDDDSQDINVENPSTTTEDAKLVRNQQQQQQQTPSQQVLPTNYVINRRPMNLLAPFRRPIRQFMVSTGRGSDRAQVRGGQDTSHDKVKRQTHFVII